jgi:hypothetical protein
MCVAYNAGVEAVSRHLQKIKILLKISLILAIMCFII